MKTASRRGTALGRLFREGMDRKGVSQEEAARAVGASQSAISFLINGRDGAKGGRYLGLKSSPGEEPLAYRLRRYLSIPEDEFNRALLRDLRTFRRAGRSATGSVTSELVKLPA